ncbi:MAG: glycosyltransferase [Deltaproteobacteria bacterium]|nr:glycosyltransferase [Deltaproteobacteria bacterium]
MPVSCSTIIPVYNRATDLCRLLESLKKQRYSGSWAIVVVDDASTEQTETAIRKFVNDTADPIVHYLRLAKNQGPSVARNAGARVAHGDFLWFLDSDAEVDSVDLLTQMIRAFEEHPGVRIVGGEKVELDGTLCMQRLTHSRNLFFQAEFVPECDAEAYSPRIIPSSNLMIRRTDFNQVGGFREDLEYLEDNDLCLRVTTSEQELLTQPNTCVVHHLSHEGRDALAGSQHYIYQYAKKFHRSRVRVIVANRLLPRLLVPAFDLYYGLRTLVAEMAERRITRVASRKIGHNISVPLYAAYHALGIVSGYRAIFQKCSP